MIIKEESYLAHYGILRRSGRYPWGSGGPEYASNRGFLDHVKNLKKEGMTESDIAKAVGLSSVTQLRDVKTIARNELIASDIAQIQRLRDKGMSPTEIGRRLSIPEATVRARLAPGAKDKIDNIESIANMLKARVEDVGYLDVGVGVERLADITSNKLSTALTMLKEQGYSVHPVKVDQLGTDHQTNYRVLVKPGVTQKDAWMNRYNIQQINSYSDDGGRSFLGLHPPLQVDSKRIGIAYAEDGGKHADGVIYIRPGVPDLSIGENRYAQVRIGVDGTHFLKGMAVYKDDLPRGVDLLFNTNKSDTGNKLDAMKPNEKGENPFGSMVRQITERDAHGNIRVTSAMNIVGSPTKPESGAEGSWDKWTRSLSSQFLSKQSPKLVKDQLDITHADRQSDLDEILKLTNPEVKRHLLNEFAENADSASWQLKAAKLPRQATQVILPLSTIKETEVYAPNFKPGERVVLIRHPHGGTFEIPELTVNNRNPEGNKVLGNAKDAIGIHHSVAQKLSGADFDGDTVIVIPNNSRRVRSDKAIESLQTFDPKREFPHYEGMPEMKEKTHGLQMGDISNLITDMTIKKAPIEEIARAVKHSMVVVDAKKHHLNYRESARVFGIQALKVKYQTREDSTGLGASTVISRKKQTIQVPHRKQGFTVDPATGKKIYRESGQMTVDKNGRPVRKTQEVKRFLETDDVRTLSSGTLVEDIYAEHANAMKALANRARLEALNVKSTPYSPDARKAFAPEVKSLDHKLDIALRNAPLERQAQIVGGANYRAIVSKYPNMERDEKKKVKAAALIEARTRVGANKQRVDITPDEWQAIQAGAVTPSRLKDILRNTDVKKVREYATPKAKVLMTSTKTARAQMLLARGYSQAEVADTLGVSLSTLKRSLGD